MSLSVSFDDLDAVSVSDPGIEGSMDLLTFDPGGRSLKAKMRTHDMKILIVIIICISVCMIFRLKNN